MVDSLRHVAVRIECHMVAFFPFGQVFVIQLGLVSNRPNKIDKF